MSYIFDFTFAWTCKTEHLERLQVPLVRSCNHNRRVMHQSISSALSLSTATVGHLPAFSAPGVRHLQILRCPWAGRLPGTRGYSRAFDTHAVSYQNITTQRILLEKIRLAHLSRTGGCKGMFSILSMHFFIAYQARIT